MKDLTMPEAEERMEAMFPERSYSISYEFWKRCYANTREHCYTISTHTPECKIFRAQTLRGAVEAAEQFHGHHVVPDLGAVQEQFASIQA